VTATDGSDAATWHGDAPSLRGLLVALWAGKGTLKKKETEDWLGRSCPVRQRHHGLSTVDDGCICMRGHLLRLRSSAARTNGGWRLCSQVAVSAWLGFKLARRKIRVAGTMESGETCPFQAFKMEHACQAHRSSLSFNNSSIRTGMRTNCPWKGEKNS